MCFDVGGKFRNGHAIAFVVVLGIDIFGGGTEKKRSHKGFGEVQAKGKAVRVGKGIDEIADEFGARAANLAIFAADGIDSPGPRAEKAGRLHRHRGRRH